MVAAAVMLTSAPAAAAPVAAAEAVIRLRRARGPKALAQRRQLEYVLDFRKNVLGVAA